MARGESLVRYRNKIVERIFAGMIKAKVLSVRDCPATSATISLVETVAKELGIDIALTKVVINTLDEANEHRFIGSPTVQLDGIDIEPSMRFVTQFGLT